MSITQTMASNVAQDSAGTAAVVNEATDGKKAVLTELATKASDNSTFTQVTASNPLATKDVTRNVKISEVLTQTVVATATTTVISAADISGFSKIYYVCRASTAHNFDVEIEADGFGFTGGIIQTDVHEGKAFVFSRHIDAPGAQINVIITNNDASSRTYSVYLGGIR